jgi:hypothetical protein
MATNPNPLSGPKPGKTPPPPPAPIPGKSSLPPPSKPAAESRQQIPPGQPGAGAFFPDTKRQEILEPELHDEAAEEPEYHEAAPSVSDASRPKQLNRLAVGTLWRPEEP